PAGGAAGDCRKTFSTGKPRRVPSSADDGMKSKSVISGDRCLGNDTSHGGRDDHFAKIESWPPCSLLSKKARRPFSTACGRSSRRGSGRVFAEVLMKHILLLTTGGTIASKATGQGLAPGISGDELAAWLPGLRGFYQITVRDILHLDSSNIQPE